MESLEQHHSEQSASISLPPFSHSPTALSVSPSSIGCGSGREASPGVFFAEDCSTAANITVDTMDGAGKEELGGGVLKSGGPRRRRQGKDRGVRMQPDLDPDSANVEKGGGSEGGEGGESSDTLLRPHSITFMDPPSAMRSPSARLKFARKSFKNAVKTVGQKMTATKTQGRTFSECLLCTNIFNG